ncbi:MAG: MerR family transcriptional regulator [Steroidobacteraceae bacterium]|nr:MerR family transcriptional regulator [Steroidobacteraceae bacterium]
MNARRAPPARPARRNDDTPVDRVPASTEVLRMRDLVRESGLPRETIHFYKLQGLLPAPIKTGRNTALYTREHLERLRHIRELQERQFLPLKAIRAILDESADEDFTPEQEDLVRRVRATLGGWVHAQQSATVPVADFVPARVPRKELRALVEAGLLQVQGTLERGRLSEDDAVILECWAQFKEAGLGPDRGVEPGEFRLYDAAMEQLVRREARLALRAYAGASVQELSRVVEQAGPIIGRLLGAMHRKRLRHFLAEVGRNGDPDS